MKTCTFTLAIVGVLAIVFPFVIAQDGVYSPFVMFHDGRPVSDPERYSCNDAAFATFMAEVKKLNPTFHRSLSVLEHPADTSMAHTMASDSKMTLVDEELSHRSLQTRPRCRTFSLYADPRCGGSRLDRRKLTMKRRGLRKLQSITTGCTEADIIHLNNTIDTVVSKMFNAKQIVQNCKNYLTTRREISCRAMVSCDIKAFHLWNGDSDSLIQDNLPETGLQFCRSLNANIEAETEFFVGRVHFKLAGPLSYFAIEMERPYFLGGNEGENILSSRTQFQAGHYTLEVFSDNGPSVKTMKFEVLDC